MYLRISSAVLMLAALVGCSSKVAPSADASTATAPDGSGWPGKVTSVPCALAAAKSFTAACTIEREIREGKVQLTVHHPDGGFRRLIELDGGKRFAAADGSDPVSSVANGQDIEVTLGDDHYLFPAAAPGPQAGTSAPAR